MAEGIHSSDFCLVTAIPCLCSALKLDKVPGLHVSIFNTPYWQHVKVIGGKSILPMFARSVLRVLVLPVG